MKKYPVLLFIPHGGLDIPEKLLGRVALNQRSILLDSDPYSLEIYKLENKVVEIIETSISRTFIDLNRTLDIQDSERLDKIVKTQTFLGESIYKKGLEPSEALINQLIETYYLPSHNRLKIEMSRKDIELCLNCHCMSPYGPPLAEDYGTARPLICLGNGKGTTCSESVLLKMADCFREAFKLEEKDVKVNSPFWGEDITMAYGTNTLPWLLVEINEDLYFREPWLKEGEDGALKMDLKRLNVLNQNFERALSLFFK